MRLKVSYYQLEIDGFIYKTLYVSIMVTATKKISVVTQKIKRKELKIPLKK